MSNYEATVIKTGNSYALRVPKRYADENNLHKGQKVQIASPVQIPSKSDKKEFFDALEKVKKLKPYRDIKDPVAWQREIRKDRPLPGRS
jgi:antitoxin component of MazEF toxin-antitoxin module